VHHQKGSSIRVKTKSGNQAVQARRRKNFLLLLSLEMEKRCSQLQRQLMKVMMGLKSSAGEKDMLII